MGLGLTGLARLGHFDWANAQRPNEITAVVAQFDASGLDEGDEGHLWP